MTNKRLPERRSALITVGGIAAVIIAGAFAVGANLGILDASSDNEIGALAAAGDLVPMTDATSAPVTTVSSAPKSAGAPQTYIVDVAGTVAVDATGDALLVTAVDTNPGWTWTVGAAADSMRVQVTFSDGSRFLVFGATRAADGSVDATVEETTSGAASAVTVSTGPSPREDSDEHDHEDREGRDDDD